MVTIVVAQMSTRPNLLDISFESTKATASGTECLSEDS